MCLFWDNSLDVGSRLINLVLLQPPWFCRGVFSSLEGMGRGWPFYFFPGVLQGSFSLPGVDVFLFRGGLFSFAGVDFFPFQGWTFSFAGWTFSSAGWPFLEERIRCRELPDYSVL